MKTLKNWIEESLWSLRNCIYFRFDRYEDNIDRLAFFCEICSGWYEMQDKYGDL